MYSLEPLADEGLSVERVQCFRDSDLASFLERFACARLCVTRTDFVARSCLAALSEGKRTSWGHGVTTGPD